jgi:hypothetical protein
MKKKSRKLIIRTSPTGKTSIHIVESYTPAPPFDPHCLVIGSMISKANQRGAGVHPS